jgi:hypothetical protein
LPTCGRGEQMMKTGVAVITRYIRGIFSLIQPKGAGLQDYFSPPRVVDLPAPTRSVSLMRSNSLQTLASQWRT